MKNLSILNFKSMIVTVKSEDQVATFRTILLDNCRVAETDENVVVVGDWAYIAFRKDNMLGNGHYYIIDPIDHTIVDNDIHDINSERVVKVKISDNGTDYQTIYQEHFSFGDLH